MMTLPPEMPSGLQDLILEGRWGTTGSECDPRILLGLARQWDPEAAGIHLISEPTTLKEDIDRVPELAAVWNLGRRRSRDVCCVADFGVGPDNPIVVDLSADPPPVLTQQWDATESRRRPQWVRIADTFDDFVAMLAI